MTIIPYPNYDNTWNAQPHTNFYTPYTYPITSETITEETFEYDERGKVKSRKVKRTTKTYQSAPYYPTITYTSPNVSVGTISAGS